MRAADLLDITARMLASVIGVSEATVSRMRREEFLLERGTKPFELAVLFVRLFRSLDAIVGGDAYCRPGMAEERQHGVRRRSA